MAVTVHRPLNIGAFNGSPCALKAVARTKNICGPETHIKPHMKFYVSNCIYIGPNPRRA
jgi:hypothetical protein